MYNFIIEWTGVMLFIITYVCYITYCMSFWLTLKFVLFKSIIFSLKELRYKTNLQGKTP